MAIAENSLPPPKKMGSSCLQILDRKIWLSSEISDPKTWHAHPYMQAWEVPPGAQLRTFLVFSRQNNHGQYQNEATKTSYVISTRPLRHGDDKTSPR